MEKDSCGTSNLESTAAVFYAPDLWNRATPSHLLRSSVRGHGIWRRTFHAVAARRHEIWYRTFHTLPALSSDFSKSTCGGLPTTS